MRRAGPVEHRWFAAFWGEEDHGGIDKARLAARLVPFQRL